MAQKKSLSPNFNEGLIPPHDIELERAVLGAILLETNKFYDLAGILNKNVFYYDRHALIYKVMKGLVAKNTPIDLLTLTRELRSIEKLEAVGGAAYLSDLTQCVGSAAHATHHARILCQLWIARTMAKELGNLATQCYTSDFDQLTAEYQTTLSTLDTLFVGSGGDKHISSILRRHGELIDERIKRANRNEIQGITYGLTELDKKTDGAQGGQLIIVAARPGMGKTAIALSFAKAAAIEGRAVTIASLEMTDLSLTDRLLSGYAGIDGKKLRSGKMNRDDILNYEIASGELAKLNISIDDTAGSTLGRLTAMSRTKHRKGDLDILIIDYLQLIEPEGDSRERQNREQQISSITRNLKKLAKDLNIPVILLCQLNRSAENRQDKQPQLYDLRESGAIEQDADVVLMPFRPSYYKDLEFCEDNGTPIPPDAGLLYIRKLREGSPGTVKFRFSDDLSRIEDYNADIDYDTANRLF